MALRRARDVERAADLEVLALVIERMQLRRIEELPARLVAHEGVVVPAVPQRGDHLGEFVGALVALGVAIVRVAVEVQRLGRHAGGDQVPAGAPAADVIERGELPRHMERLVVARRRGAGQPDALGDAGERRDQRDRLEIGDVLRRARQRIHMRLAHADVVGEEDHVELAALGGPRDLDVVLEVDPGVGLRLRVPPRRDMVAGRIEEGAEPELGFGSCHMLKLTAGRRSGASLAALTARRFLPICAARRIQG